MKSIFKFIPFVNSCLQFKKASKSETINSNTKSSECSTSLSKMAGQTTKNISIVTGTLNRVKLLPKLIENTVDADPRLELVLVDGGSEDGTIPYIKGLNHPRIKFIEIGHKSSYPHFMNIGVKEASHEFICQWNDDVILINTWDTVFNELDNNDVYIFSWKTDNYPKYKDKEWLLLNSKKEDGSGEIVLNYGIYKKDVFRKIGLYNMAYDFYCADADLAQRAWYFGLSIKNLYNVKAVALRKIKKCRTFNVDADWNAYQQHINMYAKKELPKDLEYLV